MWPRTVSMLGMALGILLVGLSCSRKAEAIADPEDASAIRGDTPMGTLLTRFGWTILVFALFIGSVMLLGFLLSSILLLIAMLIPTGYWRHKVVAAIVAVALPLVLYLFFSSALTRVSLSAASSRLSVFNLPRIGLTTMLNDLLVAFQAVATIENFLIMAAGIWGGVIIGAIPGMTGTMAVTLALPFTFYLQPIPSILLLVALYKGSTYGGSVSAILIKTPGTASAACTTLDGYPLAQQGKAGKALNMALYSSCTGDFISNLSLIFIAAPLALLALRIGPPEYFMLMIFALTTVAGVSGRSLLLGLVSACLGLLLATVGEDMYGSFRFDSPWICRAGLPLHPCSSDCLRFLSCLKLSSFDTTQVISPCSWAITALREMSYADP